MSAVKTGEQLGFWEGLEIDDVSIVDTKTHPKTIVKGSESVIYLTDHWANRDILARSHIVQKRTAILDRANPNSENDCNLFAHLNQIESSFDLGLDDIGRLALGHDYKDQWSRVFSSSSEKSDCLEELSQVVEKIPRSSTIQSDLRLIADEFFSNAIYNAPVVDHATGHNPGVSRFNEEYRYASMNKAEIYLGYGEDRVFLCVRDPFGTLNIPSILNRFIECEAKGLGESIRYGTGGAGIGTYLSFAASTSFLMLVDPSQATTFGCVLPLRMSSLKRSKIPKNLIFFELKNARSHG